MSITTIYIGWPELKVAPELGVELNPNSQHFGWLFAKHPDGQFVTVADLKPIVRRIQDMQDALDGRRKG